MSHTTPACVLTIVFKTNGVNLEFPIVKKKAEILAILNSPANGPGGRWVLPIVTAKKRKMETTLYQSDTEDFFFDANDIQFFSIEELSVAPDIVSAGRDIGMMK